MVNIVANTQPLMTALFGCMMLGERISTPEVVGLLLAFTGIFIFFSDAASPKTGNGRTNIDIKYFLVLLILPVSVAFQNVMLRSVKGFNILTMVAYSSITNLVVFGGLAWYTPAETSLLDTFTLRDNLMLISTAIYGILAMAAKQRALQYEQASRLSIVGYLSVVLMFLADYFLMGTRFTAKEIFGIIIVLSSVFFSGLAIYLRAPKRMNP